MIAREVSLHRSGRFFIAVLMLAASLALHTEPASAQTARQLAAQARAQQRALQQAIRNSRVFYVNPLGSDANSGITPQSPHKTIQKALDTVRQPQAVIYVAPGVYPETLTFRSTNRSGTAARPMRLVGDTQGLMTGAAPGSIIISGGGVRSYGIDFQGASNWRFEKLEFRGQAVANAWTTATRITGMTFAGCTFEVTPQWGVYFTNSGNLSLIGNTFLRTPASGHAMYIYQTQGTVLNITENRVSMTGNDYLSTGYRQGLVDRNSYSGSAYGIVAFVYNNTSRVTATIRNNVVSDAFLGVYFEANQPKITLVCSNNTVVGSYHGLYVSTAANAAATITNNITGDCYIAAHVNAPRALLSNHLAYGIGRTPCQPQTWSGCASIKVKTLRNIILDQTPEFEAPRIGDFALVGTVGIDAAVANGLPATDLEGTPRPIDGDGDQVAVADLGAFESPLQINRRLRVTHWSEIGTDEQ